MSSEGAQASGADRPGGENPQAAPATPERRGWPGFWPWLTTTLLLLVMIGAALWYLENREPQVVEVVGETPPPKDPAPELVARATELRQQIALRQSQLDEAIKSLDPPRCEAPKVIDPELLDKVRAAEAPNLDRWRSLLVPLPGLPQSRPGEAIPLPGDATPAPDQPAAPLKRQSSADPVVIEPTVPATPETQPAPIQTGDLARLSTDALRQALENSSVIVIGIPPKGGTGLSTGTGFFISPTTIVTNRHVIESADPQSIYVTSRAFAKIQHVRLTAKTPPGQPGQLDFATLELRGGQAAAHVALSSDRSKLTDVIAAGYPGLGLKTDSGFRELLEGDLTAAPDLNMNRGEIRSVRQLGQITQIVHTADVLQGYSGGPLMDGCGRVIGVNTFIQVDQTQAAKLNNAIAVSDLVAFLQKNGIAANVDGRKCPAE